jgi:hypothetical protein
VYDPVAMIADDRGAGIETTGRERPGALSMG